MYSDGSMAQKFMKSIGRIVKNHEKCDKAEQNVQLHWINIPECKNPSLANEYENE